MDFDERDEAEENMGLSHYEAEKPSVGASGSGSAHRKSAAGVRYRECQKNHAVSIGGHAVDGCCEFLPAGDEGSLDALRCAACNCHRNFHRKEMDGGMEPTSGGAASSALFYPYYRAPAGYLQQAHYSARPVQLALPSTSGGGREELDDVSNPMGFGFGSAGGPGSSSGKKRFRTKFSQEQKDKMLAFAEAVGWRIQKQDEATVQQFCNDASVKRHVLKVWMHNNKHSLGKKAP